MMELKMNDRIAGFTVTRVRDSAKIGGRLVEMIHDKTGALLCWADNGAENKLFSVTFRTIPENDTGVFHILEHSVLCGSDRYPVREPFLELLKSSMNTFLNAMTYPDKTVFPVSSRNERDFLNLTDVYLDAVFAPMLLKNPLIFCQEGHHLEEEDGRASENGVVLNEMKGAMSNVDDRVEQEMDRLLFPDTCYRFNSGGEPAAIPTLTEEAFRGFYNRFYHPSNARFFLDGDIPLEEVLTRIDSYISRYEKKDPMSAVPVQIPKNAEKTCFYPVDTAEENHDILTFGRIIGGYDELTRLLAAQVLCDTLASSNEAPLKKAVLENDLAEDMELFTNDGIRQPMLLLLFRNTDLARENEIRETVANTIRRLADEGIPRNELTASLNKLEFGTRQFPEPQGLYRATYALSSWLYDGDPLMYLDLEPNFRELRAMLETDGWEKLLRELFLTEDGLAVLRMKPSETLAAEEAEAAAGRAEAVWSAMPENEKEGIRNRNAELHTWQETPDMPEALAAIPVLPLSEVNTVPKELVTETEEVKGVTVLHHPAATHGVIYLSAYFPLTALDPQDFSLFSLIPHLLGELPTRKHAGHDLQREIKTWIGHLDFGISIQAPQKNTRVCTPCVTARAGFLRENYAPAAALIAEILTETDFSDKEKILTIVKQMDESYRQEMITSGHSLAGSVVRSTGSAKGAARAACSGVDAIRAIHRLAVSFDTEYEKLLVLIGRMKEWIGTASMIFSLTADEKPDAETFLRLLPEGTAVPRDMTFKGHFPGRTMIRIPAPIGYAVEGWQPEQSGIEADGSLRVAANIISLSYLWNMVRVRGGAYGTGLSSLGTDGIMCYSYRDPTPVNTLKTYEGMADFIESFGDGEESIDKYILSTIASADPMMSPLEEGIAADTFWFAGNTQEERIALRREMLGTTAETLRNWAPLLRDLAEKGPKCIVAGEDLLPKEDGWQLLTPQADD